jgi:hypothetical protein
VSKGVVAEPVPVNVTTCGLPAASSAIESVPLTSPTPPGEKVTPIVHVAPEATLGMQSSDSAKCSLVVMLPTFKAVVP